MIPLKVQIKNFLSYGPEIQTINFEQYPLICLSGKNGHGKSALLDAITWAIWGQARKLAGAVKADQGLLRLGQTQMMVSLDFESNGQQYRVRREFAQTYGKPYAALDFGIIDATTGTITSLTDKTIKDTQTKIEETIHLDFESFINSAFLRQGQSNEFSKKSAKERKEVLASILGLNRYEIVRRRAAQKVKDAQLQKITLAAIQEKIDTELLTQITIEESQRQLQEAARTLQHHEQELREHLNAQEKTKAEYLHYERESILLTQEQEQRIQEEKTKQVLLKEKLHEWKTIHRQLLHNHQQQTYEQEKQELLTQLTKHQAQAHQQLQHKEALLKQKEIVQALKNELLAQHNNEINTKKLILQKTQLEANHADNQEIDLRNQCTTLEKEIADCYHQLAPLTTQYSADDSLSIHLTQQEKQFEKRREHYQQWIAQANMLKGEGTSINHKVMLVDEDTQSCPLCEQNISAARRRFLKKKFEQTQLEFKHRLIRLSNLIKKLKPLLIDQHALIEQLKKQIQEKQINDHKIDELHKTIQKLQAQKEINNHAIKRITHKKEELNQSINSLLAEINLLEQATPLIVEQDQNYQQALSCYMQLEKEVKESLYDAAIHEAQTRRLKELQELIDIHHGLEKQRALQPSRAHTITELCSQLKSIKQKKEQIKTRIEHCHERMNAMQQAIQQSTQLNIQLAQLMQEKENLFLEQGRIENQLKKLEQLKQEKKELANTVNQLEAIIVDYYAIATATGKDGIQALLIEDAIPEIEQEANNLLSKLTDNQTHIFIESLRDLKKGGTKETLDIKISDSMGIRPYELFSGGEAFRIDFALRIAISKLLARRSGTALQTLIIDEGFGSQDEEGLAHIMDAIYKIQEDFAKIIIVSHLATMKEQFPTHFVIEKGPQGSVISILENG